MWRIHADAKNIREGPGRVPPLLRCGGKGGVLISKRTLSLLENSQRELARAVTGIVSAVPSAATLLEANRTPASVVVRPGP